MSNSTTQTILTACDTLDNLLQLKSTNRCPKIMLSYYFTTYLRSVTGKDAFTNHHLFSLLPEFKIDTVKNRNIGSKHLACKAPHLNPCGNARTALSLKATIRKL